MNHIIEKNYYMKNMLQQTQQQQQQHQQQQQQQQQSQQQPHHHQHHNQHHIQHHNHHHNNQKQQTQPQNSKLMDPQQMHVCRLCDKILSSSSSLDRHMLTHSGERPFVCKRCHMTFTTNGNMHRHMRTHLHKDSLARQQAEQQQLKSLGLIGGTSLSTTSPISSSATITCPTSINTLSSATIAAATGSGAQEASAALAASAAAAAQLNQQLVAAFKQHLLTVVQSKQNNHLDYDDDDDDDDDDDVDDDNGDGDGGDHERGRAIGDDGDDCMLSAMHDDVEHECKRERESERDRGRASGCQSGSRSEEEEGNDHLEDNMDQEEDRTMDNNDESTIDVTVKLESNRINSSITSDDEDNEDYEDEEEEGDRNRDREGDGNGNGGLNLNLNLNLDSDLDEDEEDRMMDNNDGSTIEVTETKDLNIINTSITSEDDTSFIGSDINNSLQMPLTPFASSLVASTTPTTTMNEKNNNININNNNNNNNSNNINYNNDQQLNSVESEQQITANFNQHNQLKQHLQHQQSDLQTTTLPNTDSSLNSNGSHEIIEDISQSYVKTANPNAARKGGKRNRHCYKCKLCTYSSVDRCTLVRHLRIHSGERPYICGICRYAFTTKANCERHVRKRHKKQYNSLGGAGGGGVKGSNGGGRSLIITDHSNHQTIPVKVNPVAAQTISQTLQRIQEKQQQQQSDNAPLLANTNNPTTTTTADDDLDLGRISNNNNNHHQQISSSHLDSRIDINNNSNNNSINNNNNNEATSLIGYNKSKRKHRPDETNIDHQAVPYQRRRLVDKHDDIFSTSRLSTGRKQAQHHLDVIQRQHQNNSNLLFNPQSSSFAPNLTASSGPDIPTTNELFVNLVTQLQQVITNSQQQQIEHNNNSNNNNNNTNTNSNTDTPQALRLPITSPVPAPNVSNATFLANMLAAGKIIGNAAMVASNDGQLSPGQSTSSLSPKHLSLQFASQLRNLNSQAPFFIGRNPFNPLDLAAQALDLSCKFQSSNQQHN